MPFRSEVVQLTALGDATRHTSSARAIDAPLFVASPAVIVFRGYAAHARVTARLSLRNADLVPRRVRVLPCESPFFSVSVGAGSRGDALPDSRIAPGCEVVYTVTFAPREVDDYRCDLIVATERACGGRGGAGSGGGCGSTLCIAAVA